MYINVHSYMQYCTPVLSYASSWRSDGVSPAPAGAATAIMVTMRLVAVLSESLPSLIAALTAARAAGLRVHERAVPERCWGELRRILAETLAASLVP